MNVALWSRLLGALCAAALPNNSQEQHGLKPILQDTPSVPTKVGPAQIVDYTDPTYGGKIRQLRKDDGHEHDLYYYRDVWNADGSRMLGIQSDLQQENWHVCLYDSNGVFLKDLFSISEYDWRLCWDRNNPDLLYTWKGSDLYRFHVAAGKAELLKSFAPLTLQPNGPSCNQAGDRILVVTSDRTFHSYHLPDMTDERTFQITVPRAQSHFSNLHLSWPSKVNDWFVAGFFPMSGSTSENTPGRIQAAARADNAKQAAGPGETPSATPRRPQRPRVTAQAEPTYQPPFDEILLVRLDGTTKYLARTGTVYSRAAGRGETGDMFWGQPLPSPRADGQRICFNSDRSGTVDLYILSLDAGN